MKPTSAVVLKITLFSAGLFGLAAMLPAAKSQPSPITMSCLVDNTLMNGSCGGSTSNVLFSGTGFPSHVLVVVTDNDTGLEVTDASGIFDCPGGGLSVTESLFPNTAGYTLDVYTRNGNSFLGEATATVN